MQKSINDATLNKAGDIFQYYIALRDCFKMAKGDVLQIEVNGDVSIISNKDNMSFQREVKHHFGNKNLSDRDIDFWKTLSNWYIEFDRITVFSSLILHTTSTVPKHSPFFKWNELKSKEKLKKLLSIGEVIKEKEVTFRDYYNKIFMDDVYNEELLLNILDRFTIEHSQNKIAGISEEFYQYVGHIPKENRDKYIGSLLGRILMLVKDPPHRWEINKEAFDRILQEVSPTYSNPSVRQFPNEFADQEVPKAKEEMLLEKKFVKAIKDIKFNEVITDAISDYWKSETTIIKYFRDDFLYVNSLPPYKGELKNKLKLTKLEKKYLYEGYSDNEILKYSKLMYLEVMKWEAQNFGSIVGNQGYFQRGIIHSIVEDNEFNWNVGDNNEP